MHHRTGQLCLLFGLAHGTLPAVAATDTIALYADRAVDIEQRLE